LLLLKFNFADAIEGFCMSDKSKRFKITRRQFVGGVLAGSVGFGYPAKLWAKGEKKSTANTRFNEYFSIKVADGPNPWTNLNFNNKKSNFQFAILADQTGYIDWNVFKDAIDKVNLLQPEFVMTVGDLIEGNSPKPDVIDKQWDAFDAEVDRLDMPFFYVPGNHDLRENNKLKTCEQKWHERLGRTYYHFRYNDVLFMCVSTEDLDPNAKYTWANSYISKEQIAYFEKALEDNKDVRWTMVFMHEPLFVEGFYANYGNNGWETTAGRELKRRCRGGNILFLLVTLILMTKKSEKAKSTLPSPPPEAAGIKLKRDLMLETLTI